MTESKNQLIGSIPLTKPTERVMVSISRFKDIETIDVRKQFQDKDSQDWIFTSKGVNFRKDHVQELKDLIDKASEQIK